MGRSMGEYQKPTYSPNYGFVAPNSQGPPHYGASMPPIWVKQKEGTMAKVMEVIRPI